MGGFWYGERFGSAISGSVISGGVISRSEGFEGVVEVISTCMFYFCKVWLGGLVAGM